VSTFEETNNYLNKQPDTLVRIDVEHR